MNLTQKVNFMKIVLNKQHREIKMQNEIIDDLTEQVEKSYKNKSHKPKYVNKSSTDDSGVYSSPRDTVLTDDYPNEISFTEVYEEELFVEEEINWVDEAQYHSPLCPNQVPLCDKCDNSGDSQYDYKGETKKVVKNIKNHIRGNPGVDNDKLVKLMCVKENNTANRNIEIKDMLFGLGLNCNSKGSIVEEMNKELEGFEVILESSQENLSRKASSKASLDKAFQKDKSKDVEVLALFTENMHSKSSEDYGKEDMVEY